MKKKIIPVIAAAALILVVVLFMFLGRVIEKYTPSKERADLSEYYHIASDTEAAILFNNTLIEHKAKMINGIPYLSCETVKSLINNRFYWDARENVLRYAAPDRLVSVHTESNEYTVAKDTYSLDHVIVKADSQTAYIAIDFVKLYSDFTYEVFSSPDRVVITNAWGDYTVATAKKATELRTLGGIKSPILADIEKNAELTVLKPDETWTEVVTGDGIIGYIKTKCLNESSVKEIRSDYVPEEFTHITKNFKINMAWHQVTNTSANGNIAAVLQETKGINVISPTWFYLNGNDGSIASLASNDYVNYCHQNGVEVWALVSNLENTEVSTTEVLTHTSKRDKLVNDIISAAIQYNLDGINLDFEAIDPVVEDSYIQFVRELSLKCANNGIVLSVDNYVPTDYTAFYNRKEQGLFADYVIIMGYDEHYNGSDEGSTASIGFVKTGVENTLKEVPASQVILGMPFFTRIWCKTPKAGETGETQGEDSADSYINYDLSSYAAGMSEVQNLISVNGAETRWLDDLGQYYAEYENSGSIYQIWVEDAASLEEKLKVMDSYGLAGGAFWKLGLERSAVWDTIIKYIN